MLSPFRMVCGNFILPEPASYVFFYAFSNLRNLLYIILPSSRIYVQIGKLYPKYANCGARQPSSAAAPRVIFYSVSESVIVNCASSNAASVMLCILWIVCSASGRISASISGSAIEGIGIKAKEYKEPLFSIKRGYRRRTTPPLFMILFDGAKCSSHASTIRVVVDT